MSTKIADGYEAGYALAGVGLALAGAPLWAVVLGAAAWEVFENDVKRAYLTKIPDGWTPDIPLNSVVDAASLVGGWGLVRLGRLLLRRR